MGVGDTVCMHVETHVREQAITLYGFHSEEERAWFVRLQSVQGVGPKAALAILDIMTPGQILSAASLEDKTAFARAKGIGPKSAGRIAIELSGKPAPAGRGFQPVFTKPTGGTPSEAERNEGLSDMRLRNDAVSALENLGIGQSDALRAVASAYNIGDGRDRALRPLSFDDFVGQKSAIKNLKVYVEAARRRREEPLDHLLLSGPPGLGKTTLSQIVARELGVNFRSTSGPVISKAGDLAALLTNLEPRDVLFIDEIHRLNPVVEEVLYPAMEDFELDLIIGEGLCASNFMIPKS